MIPTPRMSRAWTTLMLAALVSITAMFGCRGKPASSPEEGVPVKGISVEKISRGRIPDLFAAAGTVKARNEARLAARIPGTVARIHVREGDRVEKGNLLITLDAVESAAPAAAEAAGVDEARRGVDEARARKKLAQVTFERYDRLFAEQAVTRQEFDTRRTERDVSVQELARAEARLARARESARAAGAVASHSRVLAPLTGIVTGKSVDVGATVFPGTPLMTVEEVGRYRIEAAIPDSLLGRIRTGDAVTVTMDGSGTTGTDGTVAEIIPAVDPTSRTFTVKVDLPGNGLRSGMFGRALFRVGERDGITIPRAAVREQGALSSVWVVDDRNRVHMRLIRTGISLNDRIEILSGLSPGERVVVGGVERVYEGAKVE